MTKNLSDIIDGIRSLGLPSCYGIVTRGYQYDDAMRRYARYVKDLAALGSQITDELLVLLTDDNVDVRFAAVVTLGEHRYRSRLRSPAPRVTRFERWVRRR